MVAAIRSYALEDGSIPETAMKHIMEETGLNAVYENKDCKLKEFLTDFIKDRVPQSTCLVYLALFMCGGKDALRMEHFCWALNKMDLSKTVIQCEALRGVLECLMKLSLCTIPQMAGVTELKDEVPKLDIAELVCKWCPDCGKETMTIDEFKAWGLKCCNFCPGEARAVALKILRPEPKPKEKKAPREEAKETTDTQVKDTDELKPTKATA